MPHGCDNAAWDAAKREAKEILAERARARGKISYSELVAGLQSISFQPHDSVLSHFLGEISEEESQAGRGMMTALVVHKVGDMKPGPGFFDLAQRLGRDMADITACWVQEVQKVYAAWAPGEETP